MPIGYLCQRIFYAVLAAVSALVSDNEAASLTEIESIAETMNKDYIGFANIGVFNPLVIYLGPVMNEFLIAVKLTPDALKEAFAIHL